MHRTTPRILAAVPVLIGLAVGCPSGPTDPTQPQETLTDLPNEPGGNPLIPEVALLPWPSDAYLSPSADTATGRVVDLPAEAMPTSVSPASFARDDGFSQATAMLAWFPGGVDPASLPHESDPGASVAPDSPVLLLEGGSWEPVPVMVELDSQAERAREQSLILRPFQTLRPDTAHVVIIRDGVRAADGGELRVTDAFRALRDGIPTDSPEVEAQREDFEQVNAAIAARGLDPEEVVLAWSFHTKSEESVTGPLLAMQREMSTTTLGDVVIESDEVDGDNRIVRGHFEAPDFLGDDSLISYDADGVPTVEGQIPVGFQLTVPTLIDSPRPVIAFGHGFFSSIEEPEWNSLNHAMQAWEMSAATTWFLGFNEDDAFATTAALGGDLEGMRAVMDQQLQSQANFSALARVVREQLPALVTLDGGGDPVSVIDPTNIPYMGISNGGTQGLTIMATSDQYDRGVLVVPGGGWTHMLQRATQWLTLGAIFSNRFDDDRDLQLAIAMLQSLFDPVDGAAYAPHLVEDRFPGLPPARVTFHEAVGDAQVSNYVSEWMARSANVPLVTPTSRPVWGMEALSIPPEGLDEGSALYIYDEGYPPLPEGNVPPEENGAHETIRYLDSYKTHVQAFLEDGVLLDVCGDGGCDPN